MIEKRLDTRVLCNLCGAKCLSVSDPKWCAVIVLRDSSTMLYHLKRSAAAISLALSGQKQSKLALRSVIGCVGESWYSVLKVTGSCPGQRSADGSSQSGCSSNASDKAFFSQCRRSQGCVKEERSNPCDALYGYPSPMAW